MNCTQMWSDEQSCIFARRWQHEKRQGILSVIKQWKCMHEFYSVCIYGLMNAPKA